MLSLFQSWSFTGYFIDRDDIVAISRLRNKDLETLNIPSCCVVNVDEYHWENQVGVDDDLITEVFPLFC